jgi:hypothetical protein
MLVRMFPVLLTFATLASADVLTLRSGRTVEGQYLGGDARQIRMAIGDRVESFDIDRVSTLQFSVPPPASNDRNGDRNSDRSSDQPERRILRPDRDRDYSQPQQQPANATTELPSGTQIVVRMIDDVDSERDTVGKTFRASVDEPVNVNGQTVIPRGADVVAKLVDDKQSGKFEGRTVLTLDLMQIQVNGRMVDINTEEVSQASNSRGAKTAKVVGGTAALGAIIGAIAGGGRGAAIGAASGAAVGGGVQVLTKGQRVRIPSETRLTFTLQQSTPI